MMSRFNKKQSIIFLVFISTVVVAIFLFYGSSSIFRSANNFKTEGDSVSKDSFEIQLNELPARLNLNMPVDIKEPNNPCHLLNVPDVVQEKQAEFGEQIAKSEKLKQEVLNAHKPPLEVHRGKESGMLVALTIDTGTGGADGVEEILEIARHYKIGLTFFLTGCWVLENPQLTQKIFTEGHSIGNHSLTHLNLARASDEQAEREIAETERIIKEVLGIKTPFFRKPQYAGGERITDMLAGFDLISVQGYPDLGDTSGWRKDTTAQDVLRIIERKTAPGAIWVLHNLSPADLGAFEDIVRFHIEAGYKLVKIEEILP